MTTLTSLQTLILAAGRGTRMRSETIKVLHDLLGKPLLAHVVESALDSGSSRVISILGHQRELVEQWLNAQPYADRLGVAFQQEQKGTAHAVWSARQFFDPDIAYTAILSGDVPNMDARSLRSFFAAAIEADTDVAIVTAIVDDPARYGRIIRDDQGVRAIVEYKDATEEQRQINEINAGIYLVRTSFLADALARIMEGPADNAQNEYYLTDLIALAAEEGGVSGWPVEDPRLIQGVNTRGDLARATDFARSRINEGWMEEGVTFLDPKRTTVETDVKLSNDVVLFPDVYLAGETSIGAGTVIEPGCMIRDSKVGEGVVLKSHCYLNMASVEEGSNIGPFAHLRPGADIGPGCKVGNFVEIKKSRLDQGAKASHLTYLGDAHVGEGANVGAGTITCNYDGAKKSQTQIGQGAFIGSNTALVAPVKIGDGAYVGAGSVITDDVPDRALGIGRGRQKNIEDWADRQD